MLMWKRNATDRYLYTIHTIREKYLCVRAVDVAHYLQVSKASVSTMVHLMQKQGLIEVEPDGNLLVTPPGMERVDLLDRRICYFREFLADAGVDPSLALQDAVSFSWEMSEASFQALKAALESPGPA